MQEMTKPPLFPLGQIVATPGALAALEKAGQGPQEFFSRQERFESCRTKDSRQSSAGITSRCGKCFQTRLSHSRKSLQGSKHSSGE